jgi:excisionase family DNA binding protein
MFYSLREAAEKLNATEDQVKQLATQGKLREFRDGSNLLYKVDEVDELLSAASGAQAEQEAAAPAEEPSEAEDIEELAELESFDEFELEPEAQPEQEPVELEDTAEPAGVEEPEEEIEAPQEKSEAPQEQVEPEEESELEAQEEPEPEKKPQVEAEGTAGDEEISLAPESGIAPAESGLTEADTALTGDGISVLGETDADYDVTGDTSAETTVAPSAGGTTPEQPLEEVEEDVNLDSFGSGSGLLDLSLQADDTSLGGILDEIYTPEGGEGEPKEPTAEGSAEQVAAEAEQIMPEEIAAPEPAIATPAVVQPYAEAPPDTVSKTLGMLMFLPLAILLYTTIVAVAGLRGVVPSILTSIQGLIWYIMIGALVATGIVVGASFLLTGDFAKAGKKPKKPKAKKEKKAKKSKKGKEIEPPGEEGAV